MNIFDEVEEYLRSVEQRPKKHHHASSIVACPRRAWYQLNNVPPSEELSISAYLKMSLGNAIGSMWGDLLDKTAAKYFVKAEPLITRAGRYSPPLEANIRNAQVCTHYTAREVPFTLELPGLEIPIGARVDLVYTTKGKKPAISEVKSSHMTRTRMIVNQGYIPLDYLVQLGLYAYHYKNIPAELHYFDRQTMYPYRFGMQMLRGEMHVQPGGYGNPGSKLRERLNNMSLIDFVTARLSLIESLLPIDSPPGELHRETIKAPRDKHGEFYLISMKGFENHPSWLEDDDYHMLVYPDGELITRPKTANKVKYNPGFCPYCAWRSHCLSTL